MSETVYQRWERRRSEFVQQELERQGLTTEQPDDPYAWSGWLCAASGCLEEHHDSYGECIHCGEPVVHVWLLPIDGQERTP